MDLCVVGISNEDLQRINPNLENRPTITTQLFATEQYGLIEMIPSEFDTLVTPVNRSVAAESIEEVDIGTGKMSKDEFQALQCALGPVSC